MGSRSDDLGCAQARLEAAKEGTEGTMTVMETLSRARKRFSVGQRLMSVPISLGRTKAVFSSMPSLAVRSTPLRQNSGGRGR